MRKFRKMTACAQIRHEFSPILKSHPKKVDFGKHTFQSRCSHLLGVQISCNFVQFRGISCNFVQQLACGFCGDVLGVQISCNFVEFRAISCNGWRAVSAAMFLACKFRAIWCNFVEFRAISCNGWRAVFCADVLGVQISCNFVQRLACGFCGDVLGVQFRRVRFLQRFLGVQISCKFVTVAPLACGYWSKVLANLLARKFRANSRPQLRADSAAKFAQFSGMRSFARLRTISRIFVQFARARTCSEKISKNRLYQFCS